MGTKRPPNQRPSHDLHPVQLLQLDGRRRSIPPPDLLHADSGRHIFKHGHRKVRSTNASNPQLKQNKHVCRFHVKEWMSLAPYQAPQNAYLNGEHEAPMLESFLTFLATLVTVRTNLGKPSSISPPLTASPITCGAFRSNGDRVEPPGDDNLAVHGRQDALAADGADAGAVRHLAESGL